jgi:hypothetical protein
MIHGLIFLVDQQSAMVRTFREPIVANSGWVVTLPVEVFSQAAAVELLFHMVDAAGADGVQAD